MKYVVNEGCIGCGLCAGTCPAVFSMGDDGVAVAIEKVDRLLRLQNVLTVFEGSPSCLATVQ